MERYVENVEQLGQKISALQENISKISDGKNISQITPDVQEAADTLKDNADIMNTQAETIENWISGAGETTIDTTTVDQGISDVRNNLSQRSLRFPGLITVPWMREPGRRCRSHLKQSRPPEAVRTELILPL